MSDDLKERVRQFLADLSELSRRYGLAIGGCGCCGSPYLYELASGSGDEVATYLYWHDQRGGYRAWVPACSNEEVGADARR